MRPSSHRYFLRMARLVSTRSTCYRRAVGCVLVDEGRRVIATGYNGVASGLPHCNEKMNSGLMKHLCDGALSASGTNLSSCRAIHSEASALISCRDPHDVRIAYCTASPCIQCTSFLLNTPCEMIVFEDVYPHPESEILWKKAGRKWVRMSSQDDEETSNTAT